LLGRAIIKYNLEYHMKTTNPQRINIPHEELDTLIQGLTQLNKKVDEETLSFSIFNLVTDLKEERWSVEAFRERHDETVGVSTFPIGWYLLHKIRDEFPGLAMHLHDIHPGWMSAFTEELEKYDKATDGSYSLESLIAADRAATTRG
jgi:hypothetical protein